LKDISRDKKNAYLIPAKGDAARATTIEKKGGRSGSHGRRRKLGRSVLCVKRKHGTVGRRVKGENPQPPQPGEGKNTKSD